MNTLSFSDMELWSIEELEKKRNELRDALSKEIQKRNAIKAEIIFLQKEILMYKQGAK